MTTKWALLIRTWDMNILGIHEDYLIRLENLLAVYLGGLRHRHIQIRKRIPQSNNQRLQKSRYL